MSSLRKEIDELQSSLTQLPELRKSLEQLRPAEENLSKVSADASAKTRAAAAISKQISEIAVAESAVERFRQRTNQLRNGLESVIGSRGTQEGWPKSTTEDPLKQERSALDEVVDQLRLQLTRLQDISSRAASVSEQITGRRLPLEAENRTVRKDIEALQAGAGEITRQGQQLRERIAQIESLATLVQERRKQLVSLTAKRDSRLDKLAEVRERRFLERQQIVKSLNQSLGPRIRITIQRSGQHQAYAALIADTLKGSGIRYNELAPQVAQNMSPRELLEAAESTDLEAVNEAIGISRDRALRFLSALRDTELGRIGTVPMEDAITLSLLDGKDYKDLSELSTGQRCTVILPIVLRHTDRILVVDQPEDHIDNAFIAEL